MTGPQVPDRPRVRTYAERVSEILNAPLQPWRAAIVNQVRGRVAPDQIVEQIVMEGRRRQADRPSMLLPNKYARDMLEREVREARQPVERPPLISADIVQDRRGNLYAAPVGTRPPDWEDAAQPLTRRVADQIMGSSTFTRADRYGADHYGWRLLGRTTAYDPQRIGFTVDPDTSRYRPTQESERPVKEVSLVIEYQDGSRDIIKAHEARSAEYKRVTVNGLVDFHLTLHGVRPDNDGEVYRVRREQSS